jgi:hypothetical protein
MFVVVPVLPGITVGGAKDAMAPGGKPIADMVTTLLKGLPVGATLTRMATAPPGATSNGVCGAETA